MNHEELLKKNVTARSQDFIVDEEEGKATLSDGDRVTVGGLIAAKSVKTTKKNQMMAFLTLEDMSGNLEVILFPRDYEKYRSLLNEGDKVLVTGRVSLGDEASGKLILENLVPFEKVPRELWLKFKDREEYEKRFDEVFSRIGGYDGTDTLVVYIASSRQYKKLDASFGVDALSARDEAESVLGKGNATVVYKKI